MSCILITGGARSGKSDFAQKLALKAGAPVLFVATAEARDEDMARRIADHRVHRPAAWRTLEAATGIGPQISESIGGAGVVLVDCITLLVSNVLGQHENESDDRIEQAVKDEISRLIDCMEQNRVQFIIVTNEVGLGVVPESRLGRLYRDLLGRANQVLASYAGEVYFMVSGLPLKLKPVS